MQIFSSLFRYRDKKSPDKLGLYPERFHIPAIPERRYLWTSRLLVIIAAINISLVMILTLTIYLLLPQRSTYPLLYEQHLGTLRTLQSQTTTASPIQLLTEYHIREYINLRHNLPDRLGQLIIRWNDNSVFKSYCSEQVYSLFQEQLQMDSLKKMIIKKIRRSVEIEKIENLIGNLYSVHFKTITTYPNSEKPIITVMRAYLRVGYVDYGKNPPPEYLRNPYGFKVFSYELGYLGKNPR